MRRAASVCRAQGLVTISHGRGIQVLDRQAQPQAVPAASHQAPGMKWQRVIRALYSDIQKGTYPPGTVLPSHKELCERYGVCHRTLRKALDALCRSGRVTAHKRTYRISTVVCTPGTRSTVVMILRANPAGDPMLHSPRSAEILRSMERACARANVRLRIVGIAAELPDMGNLETLARVAQADYVIGYVVWNVALTHDVLARVYHVLARAGKPVATLGGYHEDSLVPRALLARLRTFAVDTTPQAGMTVGRFLLDYGHRKVAYIGDAPDSSHCNQRLIGLRREFSSAGFGDGVHSYYARPACREPRNTLRASASSLSSSAIGASVHKRLIAQDGHRRSLIEEALGLRERLLPVLDELAGNRSFTAWIGYNDVVALTCLDVLEAKGVAVPAEVSVIGFDDSDEAFAYRLTSYDFNVGAASTSILEFLLRWSPSPRTRRPPSCMLLGGRINERETVGRVRHG